ncbi:hypothetical protein AGMMS49992_29780 [Clostridia bacterium]|nr:hypothetical protein AGMMS49992_29780 [Clostridia bacterium]
MRRPTCPYFHARTDHTDRFAIECKRVDKPWLSPTGGYFPTPADRDEYYVRHCVEGEGCWRRDMRDKITTSRRVEQQSIDFTGC